MKTIRNIIISLVLAGGMIIAVPAVAQHSSSRQRPSASRGATTSSSRSSESRQSVQRTESRQQSARTSQGSVRSRSNDSRVTATPQTSRATSSPQVSRSTTSDRTRGTSVTPDRNRGGNVSTDRNRDGNRSTLGSGNVRNNRERPSTQISGSDNRTATKSDPIERRDRNDRGTVGNDRGGRGNNDRGGVGNDRGGRGNNDRGGLNNDRKDRDGRGGTGSDRGGRGNHDRDGRGNFDNNRGNNGGNHHGYGPNDRTGHTRPYNYDRHPHRDHFSWNYSHHNWSRPLPPPARPYRPAPLRYYRPVVPVHYRPYRGAPVIDRILGIMFGTLFDASLDYLYSSGYYIDGYADNVVYLRDVRMLNLYWPDVMLSYDGGRLANAQFVYMSNYNDRSRYNRIYHDLSAVYGPPISVEAGMSTWFGGNTTGYVTLSLGSNYNRFYTTLSIGY